MFSSILLLVGFVSISQCLTESPFANKYEEIPIDEVGFQVVLYNSFWRIFMCGGALFSPYYAITATRCVFSYRLTFHQLKVFLDTTSLYDQRYSYDITDVIIHKDYDPHMDKINDIALIKLLSPVFEGLNIQYGILPEQNEKIKNERPVKVFALDKTADVNQQVNVQVLQKELNIVNRKICRRQYERFGYFISQNHVCAHNASLGSCVGSLGFPLVDTRRRIIGIVTFPFTCGPLLKTGLPSVYTRVSSYFAWIHQIVTFRSLVSHDLRIIKIKSDDFDNDYFD